MKFKSSNRYSQTTLVGQFVSYELKDGYKVKRMNLLTAAGMVSVKLTKEARACLFRMSMETPLQPGALLSLAVTQKQDDDCVKYKVYDLQLLTTTTDVAVIELSPLHPAEITKQLKVRVCMKGTCRKRGAEKVYDRLHQEVKARGLTSQINLEKTGCLKECKQGPNVKIAKRCHSRICPAEAADLMLSKCNSGS